MKRYAFGRRTRFRFVEQDGSEAGDFEIERRAPNGHLIAISLEHGSPRTFTLSELRQAIAGQRLHFHLVGRHAQPLAEGKPSISPREPDFSALPARDRERARHRYEAIRPLIGKADRTAADVHQRADAVAQADPTKRRKNAGSSVSERTLWTWLRWYEEAGDIRGLLPRNEDLRRGRPAKSEDLHQIIADRLEARWLQRPPWPLTDVALEVVAEVERRNRDRPAAEHILLQQTAAGQVRLHTLERMVQRQAQRIDAGERIAAQRGRAASRAHWDPNVGELRVDCLLDRVDYDAVRLPILVVDEEHRLVIGRPWLVFGIERKSGMPHGYFLSWEPPNYRSVMECLLFGILPKQALNARFPSLRGTWECEGLPRAVAIDNGPEFANRHLDDAARQVDFDLLPCPVRVPWFKGIVEGFFSRLNRQLLRALPGTTFANAVERGDYDPAQHACLSLAALEEILVLFCVDYYPQRFNRHLGGRPIDLWRSDPIVRDGLVPYPPSADDLRVLMGWTEQRTVTRRGVQLEYLLYSSDDLRALRGQTVVVKIDPRDLGQVWIRDPREGQRRFIAVPANHPGYATGLSLWQHRVICRLANAEADRDNVALLVDTKARIQEIVEREWSTTRRTRSRQVLARWLNQQGGPNVVRSAQLAEQALEEATRTDGRPQRRSRSSSVRGLLDSNSPGIDAVPASTTPATITPIRRRLLAARAPFGVTYAEEELDAGGTG